ncbi:MAG: sigma-70 family RNA polymerase sigma factor [bacterium]|nr:sigma-70 family RNA polymerase sigma factor [bacterium]
MNINVEDVYKRYGPMVLRRCRQILGNEEKALDAMQDVFVQLLRNKERLKNQFLSSLLYRIATNICLNVIRYEKRHPVSGNDELVNSLAQLDDFESRTEARDILDRIFSREKESTRVIAYLHFVDGLTLEETAREAGLSVSGVRKRLRVLAQKAVLFKERYHEK